MTIFPPAEEIEKVFLKGQKPAKELPSQTFFIFCEESVEKEPVHPVFDQ